MIFEIEVLPLHSECDISHITVIKSFYMNESKFKIELCGQVLRNQPH